DGDVHAAVDGDAEGAGDGGGGHVEDVGAGAFCGEACALGDAEAVLFVDDDESEVVEGGGFGDEGVGADDDVEAALGDAFAKTSLAAGGTGEKGDAYADRFELVHQAHVMLFGEHFRGGHERDL